MFIAKCPRCGRPWDGEPLELTEDIRTCFVCGHPICARAKNIDKIRKDDVDHLGQLLEYAIYGMMCSKRTDKWFFEEFTKFYMKLREQKDTKEINVRDAVILWLKQEVQTG